MTDTVKMRIQGLVMNKRDVRLSLSHQLGEVFRIQTMLDLTSLPLDSKQRELMWSRSCERWSESECLSALRLLVDEGYLDYVYSLKSAFHTNKGRAAYLVSLRPANA